MSGAETFFGPNQSVQFAYLQSTKTSLSAGCLSGICAGLEAEVKNRSWGSYAGKMSSSLFFILPALGGYALVSQYLLKNPLVLHKKKRSGFYCTHISHRGGKSKGVSPLWTGAGSTLTWKAASSLIHSVTLGTETPAPEIIAWHRMHDVHNQALLPPPAGFWYTNTF